MPRQRLWFLVGPTASGKTAVGIEVALRIGAEVLSLDSMSLYRGMDIGTAKPSPADRARVAHHLIDLAEPHEAFSTGRYLEAAEAAIAGVAARGNRPLFVGGTALYLKALTEGLFQGPAADWELRNRLIAEAEVKGAAALHQRLQAVDPAAASRIHPNDLRRIVRALEVHESTGRPISEQQTQFGSPSPRFECALAGIRRERDELYDRINRRVDAMFAAGLVEEVRALLARPGGISHSAAQFVGYREVIAHLRGELTLAETIERMKTRTRQFAKRQGTWFRSFPQIRWVHAHPDDRPEDLAAGIIAALGLG
ncbi:MAG TPA: tRNA (adenosine(37)-N6)-dimethylallyltransferase MiaA [Planctomycetota bacterium]|nr:tRNA (adenosine(37)-N6)-dimethylallyltransferase MiaA [Planctomycetota bacterium]HRR78765.1 tRNA (adenosine(37)-N6)-dimethylallyltransferase MiaA [Planctomycetota bacterium]HRT97541.1 tRNA (adenosine(37)-N6)-dimethylallyltransferase MiaA [Planctomycetota bacterium]